MDSSWNDISFEIAQAITKPRTETLIPSPADVPHPTHPLVASTVPSPTQSYEYRRMGESSVVKPELCQVWTICLDGLDIRSSRSSSPSENPEAASDGSGSGPGKNVPGVVPSPSPQVDPDSLFRLESTLLRSGGLSPGEVTLQASFPPV